MKFISTGFALLSTAVLSVAGQSISIVSPAAGTTIKGGSKFDVVIDYTAGGLNVKQVDTYISVLPHVLASPTPPQTTWLGPILFHGQITESSTQTFTVTAPSGANGAASLYINHLYTIGGGNYLSLEFKSVDINLSATG